MAELVLDAYIPSKEEYDFYYYKFRTFMCADLSEKVRNQYRGAGAIIIPLAGSYWLRSSGSILDVDYEDEAWVGERNDTRSTAWCCSDKVFLRVALQLKYNPECKIVKDCKVVERAQWVFDSENGTIYSSEGKNRFFQSSAPIVTFGKKEYIWLNKKECERGVDKTMKLWSLKVLERAVPFSRKNYRGNNDFGKATELHAQIDRVAKEDCTEEELAMIVPVRMSDKDGYATAKPVLGKVKVKEDKKVEELPIEQDF